MIFSAVVLIVLLLAVLVLVSYVDRLYSEMGKFLAREFQENIDAWEQMVEPRLGLKRESIALSSAVLAQLTTACVALLFGALLFDRPSVTDRPTFGEAAQAVFGVILVIILFNRLLPFIFFTRTRGVWIVRLRPVLKFLFYLVMPITLLLSFLLSIAALAENPSSGEEEGSPNEAVEALIEAGEEEGILEESDSELVRSAVEFGDRIVREVMTPRPDIFAVPGTMTLEEFLQSLREHPFSRVPVYQGSLDNITGIAFSHDLLQITDEEARTRTVASIQRPAAFVPETKKGNVLLREMQREKQHMCIVIDEYGGVAGLVTIEDLLEEIVGQIRDEHEESSLRTEPIKEEDGSWILPGNFEVARLQELLGEEAWISEEEWEATTVAGLISESAGRIPQAGEVVQIEELRFEILSSTDRRIERLRVSRLPNQ
jgi:CBS domain containing-hemolysin-like protein